MTPRNARDANSAGGTIGLARAALVADERRPARAPPTASATIGARPEPIAMIPLTTPKRPSVASAAPTQSTGGRAPHHRRIGDAPRREGQR